MAQIVASTYELLECIGSGGGGVVYLGKHIRLDKLVVLKADKRKLTTRPELLRREVDALKDLSHSYIPQVYDFFTEGETVYTVIDYVQGESLDKPLRRGQKFDQPQVIQWAIQMLEALAYLHKPIHGQPPHGIVHSDIKPANIMVTPQGDIRLIDFNIALALGEENIVGLSAGYASPEHYGIDFSSDSYASHMSGGLFAGKSVKVPNASDVTTQTNNTIDNYPTEVMTEGNEETETLEDNEKSGKVSNASNVITQTNNTIDNYPTEVMTEGNEETETLEDNEKVVMSMNPKSASQTSKRIVVPDARSDIYSLGATLYHLLSGVKPAKRATDVIPLSSKDFSPTIAAIISKSMNPNPDLRYQSAEEMLYDFLHLRDNDPRTKRRKKTLAVASVSFVLLLAGCTFTAFTGLKRMQSVQKSLTLAEYSRTALKDGNSELAVQYALEALPTEKNIFIPEYTSEAKKALADALGVYDLSDGFKLTHTVELSSETFKVSLAPDGKTGVAVCAFEVTVFDTETGEIKAVLPSAKSALSDAVYIDEDRIAYAGENGLTVYSISQNSAIWTGKPATQIAVSADKSTIAGVYRNESFAVVYDINGNEKKTIDFSGNKQKVVENDIFGDPKDNLLALNNNGSYLAVSFENGGLSVFSTVNPDDDIIIFEESDYFHFEGGFMGDYFAFSAGNESVSEFWAVDTVNYIQTIGFDIDGKVGVSADESGVYIFNKNTVVEIDPQTGEQREAAFPDADVSQFSFDYDTTMVATTQNEYLFYDRDAMLTDRFDAGQTQCSFVDVSGDYAVMAGADTPIIRILNKKTYPQSDVCVYDKAYEHSEARINTDKTRLMLFDYKGFRIYDMSGGLVTEVSIPNAEQVYDQQYSKKSGNLAVIYNNAFRLYSGTDGMLIYEKEGLSSVSYAKYGVSIFDGIEVKLIDLDSGEEIQTASTGGSFGAYCGMIVTDEILNGGKFIGSGRTNDGYVFAVANGSVCNVYDENGKKKFVVPVLENTEAFFTENLIITSPLHGTPVAYSLADGKKVSDLETDAYITYVTELDNCILSQYVTAMGEHYCIMLDKEKCEPLAYMANVTDISDNEVFFDYKKGVIRSTKLYTTEELIQIAKE